MGSCFSNNHSNENPGLTGSSQPANSSTKKQHITVNVDSAESKQVKLEDSNMANYGSKEHREIRKNAAGKESSWLNMEKKIGIQIWRIEKFEVIPWPKSQYGQFYDGDSYIVLNTMKDPESNKFLYDVFFWLGSETTQDEAGTAAYKTVELDDFLDDEPVQYREVMGNESKKYLDLFRNIKILKGGIESGFTHVEKDDYAVRLLHITGYGRNNIQVYQIPLEVTHMNNSDSFILDAGDIIYQFNGNQASKDEKWRASSIVNDMKNSNTRDVKNVQHIIIDGLSDSTSDNEDIIRFWSYFSSKKPAQLKDSGSDGKVEQELTIQHVSNASGHMQYKEIERGRTLNRKLLNSDDCYIVDGGKAVYIWCGKRANKSEKRSSMAFAIEYLKNQGRDTSVPISRQMEGRETDEFWNVFAGNVSGGRKDMGNIWSRMFS